jgi:hypothetical protein
MHLTNSSLAVHMLKILIAEDCVFLSWRIKFWSVDSVQGLTDNNQVRNEIRNTWNMKYPSCPLVIWELLNTMMKSAPFKGVPTFRADIGTHAQPMHNLTRSETDEQVYSLFSKQVI